MNTAIERFISAYLFAWARVVFRARRPLVIGITGSVGKTTTKEVIAACLMHADLRPYVGSVGKTPANMNNTRGVPLVLLGFQDWPRSRAQSLAWLAAVPWRALALATFRSYPRVLVLEFAAGPKGDIARTARLAPPTVSAVTAIGPAHLEAFGTIENIAREKGALVRHTSPAGLVILGADNQYAAALERDAPAPVVKVHGRGRELSENIARAVCGFLKVPQELTERVIAERPPVKGRLDTIDLGTITVIDDSYNANPLSMQLGLDTLAERGGGRRRVAILGDMKELGPEGPRYHRDIGAAARTRADLIVGVGPLAKHYQPDSWFATSRECADAIPNLVLPGDYLLVKGSNSVDLPIVVKRLKQVAAAST
jgi:UDP-N-acetylmuramoyl-tripeptide--D-alanyl-D-alanine ligase